MECWWVGLCNYNYSEQTATSITTTTVPTLPTSTATATADRTENKVANAPNCQFIKTRFLSHYFSKFHSLYTLHTQSDLTFLSGICKLIKFLLARILEVALADEAAAVKYI